MPAGHSIALRGARKLIAFLQESYPHGLPRLRAEFAASGEVRVLQS